MTEINASLFFLIPALCFLLSCSKDEQIPVCENCDFSCLQENESDVITNACMDNWDCRFVLNPDSKVDVDEFEGLANGDNQVFQMINSTEGAIEIADDEFTNILVFELSNSQSSFSVSDNELSSMHVYYKRLCYCSEVQFIEVSSGCMQGEQQSDGSWFVQGDLEVPYAFGSIDVKFEAEFRN